MTDDLRTQLEWIYVPEDGGEEVLIGYKIERPHPGAGYRIQLRPPIVTRDPEQAEGWRQSLARGELPRWQDGSPADDGGTTPN